MSIIDISSIVYTVFRLFHNGYINIIFIKRGFISVTDVRKLLMFIVKNCCSRNSLYWPLLQAI